MDIDGIINDAILIVMVVESLLLLAMFGTWKIMFSEAKPKKQPKTTDFNDSNHVGRQSSTNAKTRKKLLHQNTKQQTT